MNKIFISSSVVIVDTFVYVLLRSCNDKPDIIRIFYEDIPIPYVIPINIFYILTLFSLVGHSQKWYFFFSQIVLMNFMFKNLLSKLSVVLKEKYDYYHLYSRYFDTNRSILFSIDALYVSLIGSVYMYFTKLKKGPTLLDGIIGLIGYFILTLTFEDL